MAQQNNKNLGGGLTGKERRLLRRVVRSSRTSASSGGGGFRSPPFLSFDPAIEAERRAAQRGLGDTAQDIRSAARRSKRDLLTELRDLGVQRKRGVQDLRRSRERSLLDVQYGREDVRTRRDRGLQDFSLQLEGLTRRFSALGRTQTQAANAAGVLGGGTMAAAEAARARNFELSRQPIDIGEQRLREDTRTSLGRLDTQAEQVREDFGRGKTRLRQDFRHDRRLAHRDYRDTLRDLHNQLQRAIREQRIGDIDLIKQEIYNARQNRPGAFSKYGKQT